MGRFVFGEDYEPYMTKWSDEEISNFALTLCHMVDKMMITYQKKKEEEFVTEGGIRERMTAARWATAPIRKRR
ncbi:MAG: four helix bundle suffix domain-containing protein [Prevotella sp.]|nr:four helix bundle suffix domain-containing protein [Prevotella sp.]